MKERSNYGLVSVAAHGCGIFWDPLAQEVVHSCGSCPEEECEYLLKQQADEPKPCSFYLGSCGLIVAYVL
jgi:hypothetical protein